MAITSEVNTVEDGQDANVFPLNSTGKDMIPVCGTQRCSPGGQTKGSSNTDIQAIEFAV